MNPNNDTMKFLTQTTLVLTIALFGFAVTLSATQLDESSADSTALTQQEQAVLFDRLEQGLLYGLNSDVNGVIDSALFNALHYKIEFPEFESEELLKAVKDLALNADTHTLRFKAYLTLTYYTNQDEFGAATELAEMVDNNDQNRVFYHLQNAVSEGPATASN